MDFPSVTTIESQVSQSCTALTSVNLPAVTVTGALSGIFSDCVALTSLTLGTTLPTLGTAASFHNDRENGGEFTIYVPNDAVKSELGTEIEYADSNWYKSLKTYIGAGNFTGVAVAH